MGHGYRSSISNCGRGGGANHTACGVEMVRDGREEEEES